MMKDLEEVPKGLAFHTEQLEAARLLTLKRLHNTWADRAHMQDAPIT